MPRGPIYSRVYSGRSPRQLVSGKGRGTAPLSHEALLDEFRNHAIRWQETPTALVSASKRIVDTVLRAFRLRDGGDGGGQSPDDIWIAFLEVPAATTARVHHAQDLAGKCGHEEPKVFSHEVVFEWAVPNQCVMHQVSLQTLLDRGLRDQLQSISAVEYVPATTRELRDCVATGLGSLGPWEIGLDFGLFARTFGARAPGYWIAHQLVDDCLPIHVRTVPGPEFRSLLEEGIENVLIDGWLTKDSFVAEYEDFKEWKDGLEDSLNSTEPWNVLRARGEEILAVIEMEAIKLGL